MSYNIRLLFLLGLLPSIILEMGCYSGDGADGSKPSKRESYEVEQWPLLMQNFSSLDDHLGSLKKLKSSSFKYFGDVLEENGIPPNLVQKIIGLVEKNDEIFNGPSYHGLIHSARVANLTAASVSAQKCSDLSKQDRALIIISAFFHDIDPKREKGTPARVWATFNWMDNDPEARSVFAQLERDGKIRTSEIKTLIKFTDFDVDEKKRTQIRIDAEGMATKHFGNRHGFATIWGTRIAFFDQVAMYVGSFKFAVQAVVGLANEFRRISALKKAASGSQEEVTAPSDVAILSSTAQFLAPRLSDENIEWLPQEMLDNLKNVHHLFQTKWSGKKSL